MKKEDEKENIRESQNVKVIVSYIRKIDIKNQNIFPDVVLCYPLANLV